jgi:hypothetical protein
MVTRHHGKYPYTAPSGLVFMALWAACNVAPAPSSTGGVALGPSGGGSGGREANHTNSQAGGGSDPGPLPGAACERGVVIVNSDYKSTNIAIAKLDGTVLSSSFVSSGATKPGLALALSGNVDVPHLAPRSGQVVLMDRFGTNVLTWMDLEQATVTAQLPIGTGFESNPHDYLEVDHHRALVSRYGSNPTPGAEPFDAGGDLLVIDLSGPAITGRIAMPEEDPSLLPRPSGMTWLNYTVVVTLGRWSSDYSLVGHGRLVAVSPATDSLAWTVDIQGLYNCGRLAVSPSGTLGAIACSSQYDKTAKKFDPATSDIVIYDLTVTPPQEQRRLGVAPALGAGIQLPLAFASEDTLLALTYGGNATSGDTAFAVSAVTGQITPLAEATQRYVFGGIHCSPGCGNLCLLSDAERNRLRRWAVGEDGTFTALDDLTVDTVVGLPPRSIGGL